MRRLSSIRLSTPRLDRLCAIALALLGSLSAGLMAQEAVKLDLRRESKLEYEAIAEYMRRSVDKRVVHPASLVQAGDKTPAHVLLRQTRALLGDIRSAGPKQDLDAAARQLKALAGEVEALASSAPRREVEDLFHRIALVRRRIALANPLLDFDEILFVKRNPAMLSHMVDQVFGIVQDPAPGGGVFVLQGAFGPEPSVRNVLASSRVANGRLKGRKLDSGVFYSPDLTFDGRTIYFAHTEADPVQMSSRVGAFDKNYSNEVTNAFHLFSVGVDGSELRQLTDGVFNDFDPCVLPDGRIAFISERRGGEGRCHPRKCPTYVMHSMNPDGSDIVCLSFHETNEWQPSVTRDGEIVYTRWDYVDRGFDQAQHPWLMRPDGTETRALHGNYRKRKAPIPHFEGDVRQIPGSRKFVATGAHHHKQTYGDLLLIDPRVPDDDSDAPVTYLTPDARYRGPGKYATAWPLSEKYYLCVYSSDTVGFGYSNEDSPRKKGVNPIEYKVRHGVYLVDCFGNRTLLYRDDDISCMSPIPLRGRPKPPVVPSQIARHVSPEALYDSQENPIRPAPRHGTAKVAVMDVYESFLPWPEGTKITRLRIVQLFPKTTPRAYNPMMSYQRGSDPNARGVLGTVPVEDDGSAYFTVPAGRPVFFQALNDKGLAVQSMRSAAYFQPGETDTCLGCHEPKTVAPRTVKSVPLALKREPSRIEPDIDESWPISFPRLVQPVLDAKCVDCHAKKDKAPDLVNRGRLKGAYMSLKPVAFCYLNSAFTPPRTVPGEFGALGSKLYPMLTTGSHADKVKLTDAQLHRITLWLDMNSMYYGSYSTNYQLQESGAKVVPVLE